MPTQGRNGWLRVVCVCLVTRFVLVYGCLRDNDCRFTSVVIGGNTIKIPQELCCRFVFPPKCIKISDMPSKCYSFPTQTIVRSSAPRQTLFPPWLNKTRTLKPRRTHKPWHPITGNSEWTVPTFEPITDLFTYISNTEGNDSNFPREAAVVGIIIMVVIILIPLTMCVRYIKAHHVVAGHNNQAFTGQETQPSHINGNVSCNRGNHINLSTIDVEGRMAGSRTLTEGGGISMGEPPPSYEDACGPCQSSLVNAVPPMQFTYNQDNLPPLPKYEDVV